MATKLYFRNTISDYATGNNDANLRSSAVAWESFALSLTAGTGTTSQSTSTVAGTTPGVESGTSSNPFVWYSPPLDADITISGSVTWNLWAAESDMSANVAINGRLEVIDGATGTITLIDQTARVTEVAVTTAAVNNFAETPGAGIACKRGDRLRVRVFGDDVGTMASGFTFTFNYNNTVAGLADSWLQLTENLTFVSEPAGTTIYPTDTASAVSTASVDREAWTSRGAGVQTDVRNTAAGFTTPLQVTDTAGGTVVDWFTKQLTAFTLGGAVRVNVRALNSSTLTFATMKCEIARVAADGTSPTVWALGQPYITNGPTASEVAYSFLISGDDLAISDGQRLRLRFYIDDSGRVGMITGRSATLYYAGTSGGASGDTYLTFSQTLTEYSAAQTVTPTTAALVITRNIPTVTASNHQSVTPTTKALTSATFAPAARTPILATPPAVSLTVTRFAPTVSSTDNQRVTPTTATLTATKYAPTVTTPERVTPITKALVLATFAPTVTVAAGAITVTVPAGSFTLATFAPTIRLNIRVTPNAVSLITSPQVPTVTASDQQRVTPITKALTLATFAPTISTPNPQLVTPTTMALVATKYAPIVGTRYYAAVQATGPIAWWRLGEPSGTNSDDEIGVADAGYVNTPTLGVASLLSGDTSTSVTFSRASLEHTATGATMPAGSSVGVSVKGWVQFATVTAATRYALARWWLNSPVTETQVYYNVAVGAWRYLYQDATGFRNTHSDAWTPSTATTYFIVVTHDYSAELVKFYVNGTLLSTEDVSVNGVPVVHAANGNASVARVGSDYWDGTQKDVAFYNGVLTPTQVLALYNAGTGAAGPQLVTPATASLVVTRYQPTVTTPNPQLVIPTTTSLVATKYAPTVRLPILATPTTKALTVTRYEPTVRLHQLVTVQKATLTVTRYAPTASTPVRATPGTTALALTAFAPIVTAGNVQSVTPATAAILLTKYVPVVSVTAHLAVVPPAATLTVTKFAPTVAATAHVAVIPTVKTLTLAPQVPTVALTAHVAVIVPKATLTITRYAPSLEQTNDQVAIPTTKALTLSVLTPTVSATAHVTLVPTTRAVAITKFAPTVRTPILATPATAALVITRFIPQARAPILATPQKLTLTLTAYQATVRTTVLVTPITKALALTAYAPTIVNPQRFVPSTTALLITRHVPIVRVAYSFTPTTKALTTARFAPAIVITAHQFATPTTRALTLTTYAPQLAISDHRLVVVTTATLTLTTFVPPVRTTGDLLPHLLIGTITQRPAWSAELTVIAANASIVSSPRSTSTIEAESGGSSITSDSHAGVITK